METENATETPPIDSMPDDHVDEGYENEPDGAQEATETDQGGEQAPEQTAEEAVLAALKKTAEEKEATSKEADKEPAVEEGGEQKEPELDEAARMEALYTIPKGLKGEARAQYKALSDHARGLDTQLNETREQTEKLTGRINTFEEIIQDSGATPEVLAGHFNYIKAITSGDLESALAFIEGERQAIARHMGKPLEGVDLLSDHPDLRQRVDSMELDEKTALELANARRMQDDHKRQQSANEQQLQSRREAEAFQAARNEALGSIEGWIAEQSKSMLPTDWEAVEGAIAEYLQADTTKAVLAKIPPSLWLDHIKQHYAFVQKHAAQRAPDTSSPTPLRPRGAGGAVDQAPQSAEEAVRARLGYR